MILASLQPRRLHFGDRYYSSVVSLQHYNEADTVATIHDIKGKVWTLAGQVQADTAQSKFGGCSMFFDGNLDYATTPDATDWDLGSGDFTIETWARFDVSRTTAGTYSALINHDDSTGSRGWTLFQAGSLGGVIRLAVRVGGVGYFADSTTVPSTGTWYHIVAQRGGGNIEIYINGTREAQTAISGAIDNPGGLCVMGALRTGASYVLNSYFRGWLDEMRVTKGVARYSGSSIPVQSSPWPNAA